MKGKYQELKAIKNNSGFGWDPVTNLPTAPDEVWEEYIKAHPRAKEFRTKSFPWYDNLDAIFSGNVATGAYVINPTTIQVEDDNCSQSSDGSAHPKKRKQDAISPINFLSPRSRQKKDDGGFPKAVMEIAQTSRDIK